MKNQKQAVNVAAKVVYPVIFALFALSLVTILCINMNDALRATHLGQHYPVPAPIATLFNYNLFQGHQAYMTGQILNNIVAYFFMLSAVVLFILSFALIKHSASLKIKSALVAILLVIPATLGMTGGFIDFVGHGFVVCFQERQPFILVAMVLIYILDFVYYVAAIVYLVNSIKLAVKVNKGEIPVDDEESVVAGDQDQEEELRSEEDEAEKRAALLKDIRTIVREELDRLDRVAIVKETVAVSTQPAPKPEPEPEPEPEEPEEPEVEEEAEEGGNELSKSISAPRVPFVEKIVKADKETQEKYNELKNDFLSYGASSRLSIAGDTFRLHRKAYVKITLVGKTLKVYFALDPKEFEDSPIPVADAGDKNAYAEVPALLKVRSNLSVKRAKELAAQAFAKDGIEREQEPANHNYVKDIRAELRAKK